jgi:hypothetical protein
MKQLRPPGFPKLAQLGSQNAMSAETANTLQIDINVKPATEATFVKPGTEATFVKPKKPLIGGEGGKQSEESISESAVAPSHDPPYYLPSEQSQLDETVKYINDRYGKKESRRDVDLVIKDSKNFSLAVEKAQEINKMIYAFRSKDLGKEDILNKFKSVASWFLDKAVDFGTGKIDFKKEGEGGFSPGGIATEVAKAGLDELRKLIKSTILKPESYEETMRAIQNTLFALKPDWKAKWDSIMAKELAKAKKAIQEYLMKLAQGESQLTEEQKKKLPFGTML